MEPSPVGRCRVCGCTAEKACRDPRTGVGCAWLDERRDLCSVCAVKIAEDRDNTIDIEAWGAVVGRMVGRINMAMDVAATCIVRHDHELAVLVLAITNLRERVARLEELLGGERRRDGNPN